MELFGKALIQELLDFTSKLIEFEDYKIYYELCQEAQKFTTPDTYAKYLYITKRNSDYKRFKTIYQHIFFGRGD